MKPRRNEEAQAPKVLSRHKKKLKFGSEGVFRWLIFNQLLSFKNTCQDTPNYNLKMQIRCIIGYVLCVTLVIHKTDFCTN
jgi:hypothetical protein